MSKTQSKSKKKKNKSKHALIDSNLTKHLIAKKIGQNIRSYKD